MRDLFTLDVRDGRRAVVAHSTRTDGDLSPSGVEPAELGRRRRRAVPVPSWHCTRQVHGRDVQRVTEATPSARVEADALVTDLSHEVLAVHTGDCVPVGLVHSEGAVAVAHAGWRGLEAGVITAAVDALRALGGSEGQVWAAIGPHIRAAHYEFGIEDLARMSERFGSSVSALTDAGTPALDLTAATVSALVEAGVDVDAVSPDCTAASAAQYWSHRARREVGRIALVAWLEHP